MNRLSDTWTRIEARLSGCAPLSPTLTLIGIISAMLST